MSRLALNLSFWDIMLCNIPDGPWTKRRVDAQDARALIEQARSSGSLRAAALKDLMIDEGARQDHALLCAALNGEHGIQLTVEDFFNDRCVNDLTSLCAGEQRPHLIVDCSYVVREPADVSSGRPRRVRDRCDVASGSITFHLIERVGPLGRV